MAQKAISLDNLATFKEAYDQYVKSLLDKRLVVLTQEEYDALPEKDPDTLYIIVEDE